MNRSSSEFTAVPCSSAAIRRCFSFFIGVVAFEPLFSGFGVVFFCWGGGLGVVRLQAMSHSLDELGVDNAEVMNARSSFISWHMDNGLAHFFSIMGLILNSFFFPMWRLNVFCCVCGGSWVHLDGMNRWEKIGLCFRRRPLWKWAVSTQGGSGGAQKWAPTGSRGPSEGRWAPIHRCFHFIYYTFHSFTN